MVKDDGGDDEVSSFSDPVQFLKGLFCFLVSVGVLI